MPIVLEQDSCNDDSTPSRWSILEYASFTLRSAVDITFAPSLRTNPPPLVTLEDLRNSKDLCPHRINGCSILQINTSTILKVGYTVTMGEAEAMCLVRKHTSVPVPRVFNAYTVGNIGFILMEKMPGRQLDECWEYLSDSSKGSIANQLRGYVQEWRSIEGPFFGSVDGGPCMDVIFKHPWENEDHLYGPFQTRKEFNEGMVEALRNSRPDKRLTEKDLLFAERLLASADHSASESKVFTHGDLHQSNIMIQDGTISGIVDWGAAGFSVGGREHFGMRWSARDSKWRELSGTVLPADEYYFWEEVNYYMMQYTCI